MFKADGGSSESEQEEELRAQNGYGRQNEEKEKPPLQPDQEKKLLEKMHDPEGVIAMVEIGKIKASNELEESDDLPIPPKASLSGYRPKSSITIGASKFPHSRELRETIGSKMFIVASISLAIVVNVLLIGCAYVLLNGVTLAVKLLSPFGATSLFGQSVRFLSTPSKCIEFEPVRIRDREWPTFNYTTGVAEFVFGTALGCMRSEGDCGFRGSNLIYGPQLLGTVNDGDTIVGAGFQLNISASCECINIDRDNTSALFVASDVPAIVNAIKTLNAPFLLHSRNVDLCGGDSSYLLPVCSTVLTDVTDINVASSFATGGSTASISLVVSEYIGKREVQSSTIPPFANALRTIFVPGMIHELPSTIPGMIPTILYWTSSNLISTDPILLDAGMETTISMLLRSGIQRTFQTKANDCPRRVSDSFRSKVHMQFSGALTMFVSGALQLVAALFSLCCAFLWLFEKAPITPAMKTLEKPTYFSNLLCESPFAANIYGTANASRHSVWQNLDVVARIGEALDTSDDTIGIIRMDRPKFVREFINGKMYA
ncbi:hypothetical protein HDU67_010372 [Dinochytrium kinnereticum]|nr:hypothetical protein HDU67_010372 [Dinochytrium kinnereticum]